MNRATSETHPIRVDAVPVDGLAGTLGLTFAPGKKGSSSVSSVSWDRDLDADLTALRDRFGTDVLVSLMRPHEYGLLSIPNLFERAEHYGMSVRRFPIDDVSVPDPEFADAFRDLIAELYADLAEGQNVTVHCRGGLGRAGTVGACVLVHAGQAPDEAMRTVREYRKGAIETRGQEKYIHEYGRWLATNRAKEGAHTGA